MEDIKVYEITPAGDKHERPELVGQLKAFTSLQEPEMMTDGHAVVDGEVIPSNAGRPVTEGVARSFPFSQGSEGYDDKSDYLIKCYLPTESFGVVYGASGSFKSFLALSWACSIAGGRSWNGNRVTKAPVLYVAGEGGKGVAKRIKEWEKLYNNDQSLEYLFKVKQPVFVGSDEEVCALVNTMRLIEDQTGQKVAAVFLDTLARCFGGADENRAADMNMFVVGCDKLRALTGASVIVVHHSGKNKEAGARGSSALRAAADFEYMVSRPKGESFFVLEGTKSKDSEEQSAEAFDLTKNFLYLDEDGDAQTTLVASMEGREPPEPNKEPVRAKITPRQEVILQAIRSRTAKNEPSTVALIRDDLKAQGENVHNYRRDLSALVERGNVQADGDILRLICLG